MAETNGTQDIVLHMLKRGYDRKSSGESAEHLRRLLSRLGRRHKWARLTLQRMEHEGCRRLWLTGLKAKRQRFKSHDGKRLAVAGAYGTPIRDSNGLRSGAFQPHLFLEMNKAELRESVALDLRQRGRLSEVVRVKRQVLKDWEVHPQAETVRDVIIACGKDPDTYEIEAEA